ncbi:MAG TPA: putative metal-binding motif-containing protein [Pseudomonadota bacterium]|nr:putative metal-binding motif-containing protein [Pseudomonadota bacterium]
MRSRSFSRFGMLSVFCLPMLSLGCGGSDEEPPIEPAKENPFAAKPECTGEKVQFKKGSRGLVVSNLEIAAVGVGLDLDGDGKPDNKLGAVASLANPELEGTFKEKHDVVIPMEFFGATSGDSSCTKFAMYLGQFLKDRDQDGKDNTWETDDGVAKGDCNDSDKSVRPGASEVIGNRMDDDCDGFADNKVKTKPADDAAAKTDDDGDGVTVANGDCDDRAVSPMVPTDDGPVPLAKLRHPKSGSVLAGIERCDGIDYNCDGIPDNAPQCDPFGNANLSMDIQKISLGPNSEPILSFRNGQVTANKLSAGPSVFRVTVPISDQVLELELSGARVEGSFRNQGPLTYLDNAVLGGVLQVVSLARLDKINVKGFLTPPQSLFDAVFANGALAEVLRLKKDADLHYMPDMDVDGDGIETFWASDPEKTPAMVDVCKDGDGTIIRNGDASVPNDDPKKRCVFAKDQKGNYRFVDGISAALKFQAVPAKLGELVDSTVTK